MDFTERFNLLVPLGESSFATVWSAEDARLKRKVALALLEDDAPAELAARLEPWLELDRTKLRSPNLAPIVDAGRSDEDLPYIASELLDAPTLESMIEDGPAFSVDKALRLVADLAGALAALHDLGLTHGDLEPGNIRVGERRGQLTPKLIGLGYNRALHRSGALVLESSEHLATVAYAAPEQGRGEEVASASADVYSLAALFFRLLTGRLPHRGANLAELRENVGELHVPAVRDVRAEIEAVIANVVDRALSHDIADRYESAAAFQKAVRGAMIGAREARTQEIVLGAAETAPDDSDRELSDKRAAMPVPGKKPTLPKRNPSAFPKPSSTSGFPRAGLASGGVPKIPMAGLPKVSLPKSGLPKAGLPKAGLPKPGLPKPGLPKSGLPPIQKSARKLPAVPRPSTIPPPVADSEDYEAELAEFDEVSGLLEISAPSGPTKPKTLPPPPPREGAKAGKPPSIPVPKLDAKPPIPAPKTEAAESARSDEDDAREPEAPSESEPDAGTSAETTSGERGDAPPDAEPDEKESDEKESDEEAAEGSPSDASDPKPEEEEEEDEAAPSLAELAPKKQPEQEEGEDLFAASPALSEPSDPASSAVIAAAVVPADDGASKPPVWVWAAAAALALVVIGGGIVWAMSGDDAPSPDPAQPRDSEPAATAEPATPEPAATAEPATPEPVIEEPAVEEPAVEEPTEPSPPAITLVGLPEGAVVRLDGRRMEGSTVQFEDTHTHVIAVFHEGHRTWRQRVEGAAGDQSFTVELIPYRTSTGSRSSGSRSTGSRSTGGRSSTGSRSTAGRSTTGGSSATRGTGSGSRRRRVGAATNPGF